MTQEEILITLKMLDEGIIPFSWPQENLDLRLSTMDHEKQKFAKRKFRKLWRKALKNLMRNVIHFYNLSKSCGVGLSNDELTSQHRRNRASLVYQLLRSRL